MAHRTILLIDYEPRSIERFRQPLTDAGYAVEVATDGVTGIEAFHRLNPDMVLVEAMIPKRHGFEVCQELKRTPHGKRTPVLITTGVYKGRKYRTQALHIYGCDEYIEKPIAPEQLLAVVGKFFTASGSSAGGGGVEPRETAGVAAGEPPTAAKMTSAEPSPARSAMIKPPARGSIVKDFTEEEIMARLDAILPGELLSSAPMETAAPLEIPAPIEEPAPIASIPVEAPIQEVPSERAAPAAHEVDDPFAQMQAELTAELGSMSAALALEPAPVFDPLPQSFPSDQAAAPSLLESLPTPAEEPAAPAETTPAVETPGQLVNFDAGRSRRKKKGKAAAAQAQKAATPPPPARVTPIAESMRPQADPPAPAPATAAMTLPHGTLAEAELAGKPARRGVPAWIWAALAIAGLAAAYFLFLRPRASEPEPSFTANESSTSTPQRSSEPAANPPATETKQPLLNAIEPLQARPAPAASVSETKPATASADTTAGVPNAKPAGGDPMSTKARASKPATPSAISAWKPTPEQQAPITAPAGADEGVSAVESVVESPAAPPAPTPTVAAGSLIEAQELDSAPVSLSRKVPVYSMQARQLRIQGTVVMKVLVNERGTVDDVTLVQGVPGADVNDAAMRAARSWTYRPATKAGVAVKTWKVEQVTFKM